MSEQPLKKQKLESAPGADEKTLAELSEVQDSLEKLNEASAEEILQIDKKYAQKKKPHYQKRSEVVKKLPDFWITAFASHPTFASIINEEDQAIFESLEDLVVDDIDAGERQGYRIVMKFKPNNYFTNASLTKEYVVNPEGQLTSNISQIKWKESKDAKKREEREQGFFSVLFRDLGDNEDEIAELLHDDLWPNAIKYYQGLVDTEEDLEFDNEDDEGDEQEGDEPEEE